MVLFRVAAAVYFLADLLVPAAPVVVLACRVAISGLAPHASRGVVGQWRGAGGAVCENHGLICDMRGVGVCVRVRCLDSRAKTGFR